MRFLIPLRARAQVRDQGLPIALDLHTEPARSVPTSIWQTICYADIKVHKSWLVAGARALVPPFDRCSVIWAMV